LLLSCRLATSAETMSRGGRDRGGGGEELSCKLYVGGLSADTSSEEQKLQLEDAFGRYGRIRKVWVARRPPGFAFIEFDDSRDADDAARGMDGRNINGMRVRVELSHGRRRNGGGYGGDRDGYGGGGRGGGGGYGGGGGRGRSRSRSPYRGGGGGGRGGGRSRSRSPPPRGSPRYDKKRSASRSRSPAARSRSRSASH